MSKPTIHPDDIVILGARRTPQGKLLGQLAGVSAVDLGATAARAALEDSGVTPQDLDMVIFGQVVQAGAGQNPARQTAVAAGVPLETPALTVNSVCLSGLRAIIDAARLLKLGEAQVVLAGGQESMSQAPHVLPSSRTGSSYGTVSLIDSIEHDALTDAFDQNSMGVNTDHGNLALEVSRSSQDEVAAASHQRAAAAWESGAFAAEIAPVSVPQRRGEAVIIDTDQGIRPESTAESLGKLRPAFLPEGTITAGNSSPLSDGAAAVVLSTRSWAAEQGFEVLATLGVWAHVGGPDTSLHAQPANAISTALDKAGWEVSDLDLLEINEAFASVSVISTEQLGVDPEKVNIHGGAIALGHPVGASGARLVVHAAHELASRNTGRAAVSLCGGGGQGDALLLWR